MTWLRVGVTVLVIAGAGGEAGAQVDAQCPRSIQTQQTLVGAFKGWVGHVDDPFAGGTGRRDARAPIKSDLRQVTLYDGHPSEKASLAPDRTEKNRNSWDLSYDNRPRAYWIGCHYGGTNVMLISELPRGIKACEVFYRDDFTFVERVACK